MTAQWLLNDNVSLLERENGTPLVRSVSRLRDRILQRYAPILAPLLATFISAIVCHAPVARYPFFPPDFRLIVSTARSMLIRGPPPAVERRRRCKPVISRILSYRKHTFTRCIEYTTLLVPFFHVNRFISRRSWIVESWSRIKIAAIVCIIMFSEKFSTRGFLPFYFIALIYLSNVSIHSSFNRADVDGYGIEWEFDSYFFEINTLIVHFPRIHIVEISKKQIENPYSFGNYIQETRPLLLSGEKYRYFCHARNLAPRYKPARSDAKFHRVLRTVIFITIVTARENRTAAMISSRRSEKEGERERERERERFRFYFIYPPPVGQWNIQIFRLNRGTIEQRSNTAAHDLWLYVGRETIG